MFTNMPGNWADIATADIFRQGRFRDIIEELPPNDNILRATNAFMPLREVDTQTKQTLILSSAFGMTRPLGDLGSQHAYVQGPRIVSIEHRIAYWREAVQLDEKIITLLYDAFLTNNRRMLDEYIVRVLNMLNIRVDTRIEWSTMETLLNGSYTVNEWGLLYSTTPIGIKSYLTVNVTSAPWSSGGVWSNTTNAKPLKDIREMRNYLREHGIETEELWMPPEVAGYLEDNSEVRSLIVGSPLFSQGLISAERLFETGLVSEFKGLRVVVDDRRYKEEYMVTEAASAGQNSVVVENVDRIVSGDVAVVINRNYQSARLVVSSVTSATRTITFSTNLSFALEPGDTVLISKRFFSKKDRVIFKGRINGILGASWVSVPSFAGSDKFGAPMAGKTPWSYFQFERNPKYIEIGNGIHGGPVVDQQAWGVLIVA